MSGKIERPRGTHDVVPAEMPLWQRVTSEVERLCALYGYRKVLTPVFEDTALFARTKDEYLRERLTDVRDVIVRLSVPQD